MPFIHRGRNRGLRADVAAISAIRAWQGFMIGAAMEFCDDWWNLDLFCQGTIIVLPGFAKSDSIFYYVTFVI
jgi:hypothetical protein